VCFLSNTDKLAVVLYYIYSVSSIVKDARLVTKLLSYLVSTMEQLTLNYS